MAAIQLTGASLRGHGRRLTSALLAITLAVAFVATTLLVSDSLQQRFTRDARAAVGDAAVVVTTRGDRLPLATADAVRRLPGVTRVDAAASDYLVMQALGQQRHVIGQTPARGMSATQGRLPSAGGEVALTPRVAGRDRVAVGAAVAFVDPEGRPHAARVVGLAEPPVGIASVFDVVYAGAADIGLWGGRPGYSELKVAGDDPQRLASAVAAVDGVARVEPVVRTGAEEVASRVDDLGASMRVLMQMLLGFAAIAVAVAAMVIANTFAILLAQRTRDLALLRCVGARRSQVLGSVLLEALVLGAVGSLAGLALGGVLAQVVVVATARTDMALGSVAVAPLSLAVPAAVGVLVTLVACLVPARRATRVAPLAALRPADAGVARRAGRVRVAVGVLLVAAGVAALVVGASAGEVLIGVAGGLVSFAGVLVVAVVLVPGVARLLGAVAAGLARVPGKLASDNARRNPGRAAATASALLVGVTLITMMSVGAATAERAVTDELDRRRPVDLIVGVRQGEVPAAARAAVAGSRDVAASGSVWNAESEARHAGEALDEPVLAVSPEAIRASRRPDAFAGLASGVVLLPTAAGVPDGAEVTLGEGTRTVRLRASVTAGHVGYAVVTPADLRRVDPGVEALYVRFAPTGDVRAASGRVVDAVQRASGSVLIQPVAESRQETADQVGVVLLVVTGLLAVAVVISLVGVGNTLGLSVLERRREIGLLRALGLTRRQVRSSLGIEALLLSAVAVVLGLGLGVGYGWAGARALLARHVADLPLVVPWDRLAVVAAVTLAAGWLASVLPGRRAARVSPATALASE